MRDQLSPSTAELHRPTFHAVDGFSGNYQDASQLQWRLCPVCNAAQHRSVLTMSDFQFFTDAAYTAKRVNITQVQCRQCLAVFMNPCYSDRGFVQLFAEAGRSYGSSALRPGEQREWLAARRLLQPDAVVLDVGCYDGGFLGCLPDAMSRHGVDIDAPAIARGREQYPALTLVHASFTEFTPVRPPDLITMFHVLEHLTDPVAVLRRLHRVAAAGAHLVVEVPVLNHGQTNDVNGFFSAGHVTHFSQQSLANAMARAGWQVLEAAKIDGYNGWRVVAARHSAQADIVPDAADIAACHQAMAAWYEAQHAVESKLPALAGQDQVVLWGAGLHTEFLYQLTSLFQSSMRRFLLVDSDPLKQGMSWRGIPIEPPTVLRHLDWQHTHLLISSYGGQPDIERAAQALGVPARLVLSLYDEVNIH